jgi:HK97 gp10 family phage protein
MWRLSERLWAAVAKADFKMPEDFLLKLSTLGERTDEIIPRVLEAGGEVVLARAKSNLRAVVGRGTKYDSRSTGELADALGVSGARIDRDGNYNVKVGFSEPRHDGESNAKLANIIEYGKHGQPPKSFMKPAKSQTKAACIDAMKAQLEKEIDGI